MDRPCDQLLAGPAFAHDHDGKRAPGDARECLERRPHRGRHRGEPRNSVQQIAVLRGGVPEPEKGAPSLDDVSVSQAGLGAGTTVHPRPVGRERIGDPPLPLPPDEPGVVRGEPCVRHLEAELARVLRARSPPRGSAPQKHRVDVRERMPRGARERTVAFERDDDLRHGLRHRERRAGGAEHRRVALDFAAGEGKGHRLFLGTSAGRERSPARSHGVEQIVGVGRALEQVGRDGLVAVRPRLLDRGARRERSLQ